MSDKQAFAPEDKLYRPDVDYRLATKHLLRFLLNAVLLTILCYCLFRQVLSLFTPKHIPLHLFLVIFSSWIVIIFLYKLKRIMIFSIRLYQRYASSETRLHCCYEPSCSEYAILAISKFGVIKATIKTIKRLRKCKPPFKVDYP